MHVVWWLMLRIKVVLWEPRHFRPQALGRLSLQDRHIPDQIKGLILHRTVVPNSGRTSLCFAHLVHWNLPNAYGGFGIRSSQIGPRDLPVERGLPERLVFGVKENAGISFIFDPEAKLLLGDCFLAVEDPGREGGNESVPVSHSCSHT